MDKPSLQIVSSAEHTCSKCGGAGPFYKQKARGTTRDRETSHCVACILGKQKQDRQSDPEAASIRKRNRTHHIDFKLMWREQKGLCAMCHKPLEILSTHVDHDHGCCPKAGSCGRCVRGLVHPRCNLIVGSARDDIELLKCSINYLEHWNGRKS